MFKEKFNYMEKYTYVYKCYFFPYENWTKDHASHGTFSDNSWLRAFFVQFLQRKQFRQLIFDDCFCNASCTLLKSHINYMIITSSLVSLIYKLRGCHATVIFWSDTRNILNKLTCNRYTIIGITEGLCFLSNGFCMTKWA